MEHVPSSEEHTTAVKGHDGRRNERLSCNPTIVQAYVDGRERPVAAQVVEVSKSGVQLVLAEPLPVGGHVRIEIGALIVQGDIRYCKPRDDNESWAAGILMCHVSSK